MLFSLQQHQELVHVQLQQHLRLIKVKVMTMAMEDVAVTKKEGLNPLFFLSRNNQ
jgi:hypothetical protein